jgi:hypothetical protein
MLFIYGSEQQRIDNNKKCRQIAGNFDAMVMQRYNAGCIAQWSTSRASLEATGCRHRSSACAVLPAAAMVDEF